MLRKLFATDDSAATAILRLVLGVVFFAHGAQKMLGWFGGFGFSGTMGYFTGTMHIPAPLWPPWQSLPSSSAGWG
jgi:putative oxidoreductase